MQTGIEGETTQPIRGRHDSARTKLGRQRSFNSETDEAFREFAWLEEIHNSQSQPR